MFIKKPTQPTTSSEQQTKSPPQQEWPKVTPPGGIVRVTLSNLQYKAGTGFEGPTRVTLRALDQEKDEEEEEKAKEPIQQEFILRVSGYPSEFKRNYSAYSIPFKFPFDADESKSFFPCVLDVPMDGYRNIGICLLKHNHTKTDGEDDDGVVGSCGLTWARKSESSYGVRPEKNDSSQVLTKTDVQLDKVFDSHGRPLSRNTPYFLSFQVAQKEEVDVRAEWVSLNSWPPLKCYLTPEGDCMIVIRQDKYGDGYINSVNIAKSAPHVANYHWTNGGLLITSDEDWSQRPFQAYLDKCKATRLVTSVRVKDFVEPHIIYNAETRELETQILYKGAPVSESQGGGNCVRPLTSRPYNAEALSVLFDEKFNEHIEGWVDPEFNVLCVYCPAITAITPQKSHELWSMTFCGFVKLLPDDPSLKWARPAQVISWRA